MEESKKIQICYEIFSENDEKLVCDENLLNIFKERAEKVFGKSGLDLARIEKCYLEERIYDKISRWVIIIDLYFESFDKMLKIKPKSIEDEAINNLMPVDDLKQMKMDGWNRMESDITT